MPLGGSLGKLRCSVHIRTMTCKTQEYGPHDRSVIAVSMERFSLAHAHGHGGKKYDSIHLCRMPNFHPHRLMGPKLWLPHLQRWEKATNEAQGVVIYHFRLRVWLYITSDDISTYHYLEDILNGQSSAQLWNCFHATMGRHQPNRITVSTRTARW